MMIVFRIIHVNACKKHFKAYDILKVLKTTQSDSFHNRSVIRRREKVEWKERIPLSEKDPALCKSFSE